MIGLVDYGMGNLRSVFNAVESLGFEISLAENEPQVRAVDRLILPGVGSYAKAVENLRKQGLDAGIREHVQSGKPLLGICLGMQVLSTIGNEPARCEGLDIVPGEVELMEVPPGHRLPHVGWNTIRLTRSHPLFHATKSNADLYFVHSYHFRAGDSRDVLAETDYGTRFISVVARRNVVGVQFHPEKSQATGLKILANFCEWDGAC